MDNKEVYPTKDLYEAAYLYATSQELIGLEPRGNYYLFVFKDKDSCGKASLLYWQNKGLVNAKAMSDAIRTLKDLIFSKS